MAAWVPISLGALLAPDGLVEHAMAALAEAAVGIGAADETRTTAPLPRPRLRLRTRVRNGVVGRPGRQRFLLQM